MEFLPESKGRHARARRIKLAIWRERYRLLVDAVPKPTRKKFDRADIGLAGGQFKDRPDGCRSGRRFREKFLGIKLLHIDGVIRVFHRNEGCPERFDRLRGEFTRTRELSD